MIPRAILSPVFSMARPARPPAECRAVAEAAALVRAETGLTTGEAIAGIIAVRVVVALSGFLDEDADPLLALVGELRRRTLLTPYDTLATDPEIDTLSLFVEEQVQQIRNRAGVRFRRSEEAERQEAWASVRDRLRGRYIRALRR